MEYQSLGRSDIRVSKIGMGAWQASPEWSGRDDEVEKAVLRSHELGVTLFDTAEAYGRGHSEEVLAKAVKKMGRETLVIATKVHGANLGRTELAKACKASAARLGVKVIDVYQVHWPDPWAQIPLRDTMRELERLYLEGRIRAIGVSNFAVRDLEEARSFLSHTDIVSNQVRYNLVQRNIEAEVLPYCKRERISVLAWSPLAQGALTGKYGGGKVPKGDVRADNELFRERNLAQLEKLMGKIAPVAKAHGKTVAQVALAWLATNPIVVPIPGAKNQSQAEENAGAGDLVLGKEELGQLDQASESTAVDYFPAIR